MSDANLKIGDTAPDFTLPDDQGNPVKLSALRGKRVILYFYPTDDTPGCAKQACDFRDRYPQLIDKNALVLGVSPQDAGSHQKFKNKYNLPFPLLTDADHTVALKYGAWGKKNQYGRLFSGIIRSHFVIDEKGKLVDMQIKVPAKESAELATAALKSK